MSEEDYLGGMAGGIQGLGILNALKTGDSRTDMIVALLLPFALQRLLGLVKALQKYFDYDSWKRWWTGRKPVTWHERTISYRSQANINGGSVSVDSDSQNYVLIKAIRLFCHSKVDLHLKQADLSLTTMEDRSSGRNHSSYGRTVVGILQRLKIVKNPPHQKWHDLGTYGSPCNVWMKIDSSQSGSNDGGDKNAEKKVQVTTFSFRSHDGASIDAFIRTAYKWYISELKKSEDQSRYYYDLQAKSTTESNSDSDSNTAKQYTRFRLSEDKTFKSLFFPEKKSILKLVDSFTKKKGKYALEGYPNKLGLLLHGPPGTGKTSFIKALAKHTGRSIVNVPLSKISTNAKLMSIFFDKNFFVQGEGVAIKLDFKDVIFVMEDIDAASDVVKRRDGKQASDLIEAHQLDLPAPKSIWQLLLESSDPECKKLVKTLMKKSDRLKEEALKPETVESVAKRLTSLPGLGFVGETNDKTLNKLTDDAVRTSRSLLAQQAAVDKFMSAHAQTINELLDLGAEINEEVLLGSEQPSFHSLMRPSMSRGTSYSKQNDTASLHAAKTSSPVDEKMWPPLGVLPSSDADKPKPDLSPYMSMFTPPDRLNLTGILNVLDGVVDTPDRIVIMTTNHPEHLDPALIRPGRIDKKLNLGYMAASDIIAMLEHYFQTALDETQRNRVETAVCGPDKGSRLNMTPAEVEQLTGEHDDVEEMIQVLEKKKSSLFPLSSE